MFVLITHTQQRMYFGSLDDMFDYMREHPEIRSGWAGRRMP